MTCTNARHVGYASSAVMAALFFCSQFAEANDKWASIQRLASPQSAAGAHFGAALAMSGTRMAVGEPDATVFGTVGAGNVYIFDQNPTTKQWLVSANIQAENPGSNLPHGHFGASVALSGNHLMVGIPDADCCEDPVLARIGFVSFFEKNTTTGIWESAGGHSGSEALEHYGTAVAMDGDIAVVSAIPENDVNEFAEIHTYNGFGWSAGDNLFPSVGTAHMHFGASVAIMASTNAPGGALVVVGAPYYSPAGATNSGAAFTFNIQNASWQAFRTLLDNPVTVADQFGASVGLTQNRVVVGASGRNSPGGTQNLGGVDTYTLSGSSFTLEDHLYTQQQSANALVGASLAITADPFTPVMVVGAPLGNGASDAGSGFLFKVISTQSGNAWIQDDRITLGSDAADNDQFGTSVAIAGKYAAVGVPLREQVPALTDSGIVEIFTIDTIFNDGFEKPP